MGALSIPKPSVKLDAYGRDPGSPSERLRRRGKAAGGGWTKLQFSLLADLPRLSRGKSCTDLILMILAHQDAANHDGYTKPLTLAEWAQLAGCDERELQRNRDYLKSRKMASCKVTTKREYSFKLIPENWQAAIDYKDWQDKQTKSEEAIEEDAAPDADEELKPGNWRMSKPVALKAGKPSKAFKPDVGMAQWKVEVANLDATVFGMVQGGTLLVKITGAAALASVKGTEKAKSEANKTSSEDSRRHGCRPESPKPAGPLPPRAGELVGIFDDLLQKSGSPLLSFEGSRKLLDAACVALADTPRNFLIEFLNKPGGRGSRAITTRAVPGICADCTKAFKANPTTPNGSPLSPKSQKALGILKKLHGKD